MDVITSRHHPIVKEFRDLARERRTADAARRLAPARRSGGRRRRGREDRDLRSADRATKRPSSIDCVATARRSSRCPGTVLNALSPVNSPTGVVASARIPSVTSASVLAPAPALVLAAAGLQDPGNAGAIIRSAAAAGATGVVLDELSADPWGWKALRASMGSAFHLPVVRSRALAALIAEWRQAGVRIVATVPRGGVPMYDVDFTQADRGAARRRRRGPPRGSRGRGRHARQHSDARRGRIAERRGRRRGAVVRGRSARRTADEPVRRRTRRRSIRRPFRSPSGCGRDRSTRSSARTIWSRPAGRCAR